MVDKAIMATLPTIDISVFTVIVGSYRLMREHVPYDARFRAVRYVSTCLSIRAGDDGLHLGRCGHFHQPMSLAHSASRSAFLQRYPLCSQRCLPRLQRYAPRLQRWSAAWLLPVAIPSTWSPLCGGSASGVSVPSAAHRGP